MSQLDTGILARLEALEREQGVLRRSARRWRVGCLAALMVGGGGVMLAASRQPEVADVVRARSIEVVSADDEVVAALGSDELGGFLKVYDAEGTDVIGAEVSEYGGFVRVHASDGDSVGVIDVTEGGHACFDLWSGGELRTRMAIDSNECGAVLTKNKEGQMSALMGTGDSGPGMVLTYRDDEVFAGVSSDPDGRLPLLFVASRDGANAVEIRTNRRGEGEVFVSDRNGEGTLYGHGGK